MTKSKLRSIVEIGISANMDASEISVALKINLQQVEAMYDAIMAEREPIPLRELTDDERARTDHRFAAWLRSKRGAHATLAGKL